jgi:hypothetical protein
MDSPSPETTGIRRWVGRARRGTRTAGVISALALGASLLAVSPASAASDPGVPNLLKACSWASTCVFHPQSFHTYIGPAHQVGAKAYNCANTTTDHAITWSDTTGATNNVGVSITSGMKFWEVYEVEVTASYSHSWQTSHTDSETDTVHIPPGYVGWLTRGTAKEQATGWYDISFKHRYYGHFQWYVHNYTSSAENVDHTNDGYIAAHDRRMTASELKSICHR